MSTAITWKNSSIPDWLNCVWKITVSTKLTYCSNSQRNSSIYTGIFGDLDTASCIVN